MDLVTQGILGATVGQAGFYRSLGWRALIWGALIGMLPDLDVIVKFSSNPFAEILYHRGVTHSLWFGPATGPLLGYVLWRIYRKHDPLSSWIGLGIWALITHPLLDLFTVYGTQLLAPFSNHRFTLSAIPIIDPVYTGLLALALFAGVIFHRRIWTCVTAASLALTLTTGYLFYGLSQNDQAKAYARRQLAEEGLPHADVRVYTTMFQLFLRRIVVHFPDEVWIGFLTTWAPKKIIWHKQPQAPGSIRQAILNHPYGQIYQWFTGDELIFQPHGKGMGTQWEMLDARYGFIGNTLSGKWGRILTLDSKGTVCKDISPLNISLNVNFEDFVSFWKTAFGKSDQFLYPSFKDSE